jgi:low affinity Fe/Cu permease
MVAVAIIPEAISTTLSNIVMTLSPIIWTGKPPIVCVNAYVWQLAKTLSTAVASLRTIIQQEVHRQSSKANNLQVETILKCPTSLTLASQCTMISV